MSYVHIDEAYLAPNSLLSSEDRASLAFVNSSQIQEWTVAKIEDYTKRIETLKAVHNSAATINRKLPPDVLLEVFSQLEPDQRFEGWYDVLHVCRLWRGLLFRYPTFWVDVLRTPRNLVGVTERSMARLTHFLDLARAHPLELSLVGLPQSASRALSSHAYHIAVLELEANQRDLAMLNSLINTGLPLLTRLSVTHRYDIRNNRNFPALNLYSDKLPRLRSLKMPSRSPINHLGDTVAQLKHIELYGCKCHPCQATDVRYWDLLCTLNLCIALETLELTDLYLRDVPDPESDGGCNPVSLPFLRRLNLLDSPELVATLLADLSLPKTCFVKLPRDAKHSFESVLPEDRELFHPIMSADEVFVEFDEEEHATLRTYAKGSQLLETQCPGPSECWSQFFQLVFQIAELFAPSRTVTKLTLRSAPPLGNTIGDHAVCLRALLGAFPTLISLDTTAYDGTGDLLSTLGEVLDTGLCHCPLLLELRVRWGYQRLRPNRGSDWLSPKVPSVPYRTGPQALRHFCDAVVAVLKRRAGRAMRLFTLSITILPGEDGHQPSWTALVEQERKRLQEELGASKLVLNIAVSYAQDL